MVTRHDIEQGAQRLDAAIARAIAVPQTVNLAAVESVLHEAATAVESLLAPRAGVLSSEQFHRYFPSRDAAPTATDMQRADERWQEAFTRGRRFRKEARERVGPLLTPAQTAERLGVSAVTVNKWRWRGKLLGLRFDDHQYLYPLFQFADSPLQGERGVLRHLDAVLTVMSDRADWEKALFLLAPLPALHSQSPVEILAAGPSPNLLKRLTDFARHAGEMGQ